MSAEHWERQIERAKSNKKLIMLKCPFCDECNDRCVLCKIDKKICDMTTIGADSMIRSIIDAKKESLESALILAEKLLKVLKKKGRLL